jgi:pimeloyl-ACP methyl ester carboxylesterase
MHSDKSFVIKLKDKRKLGYAEYGDPKGKPIFFFHGWPVSRLSGGIADKTAKKLKIRIISPDRPGYGLSDFKKNRELLDWPDDVVELADKLNIKKFAVVGVSGGGPYAAVCAYKIPQRLSKVSIVVGLGPTWIKGSLDGMSWSSKIGWANYARFPITATMGAYLNGLIANHFPSLGIFRFMFGSKSDRLINFKRTFQSSLQENFREAFRQGYKAAEQDLNLYTRDWGFALKDIKIPVYLWYGADDKNVSLNMGKYYASEIKNSKLKVYTGEAH